MISHGQHVIAGAAAFAVALAIYSVTINRLVKRKLRLSIFLFGAYVLANAVFHFVTPEALHSSDPDLRSFETLALAAGLINLVVITLINPLRADRVPERFPTIVQDFIVIALVLFAATFVSDKLIATSAVSAVVIGFALQDTLGNAFAGLAIQSEKPFHLGHWIRVGDLEGRVTEVTWRATKLRTKTGNFVIVPNNVVAKEPIVNYSQPAAPTRIEVEVGASYLVAPNLVKQAMREALANSPHALLAPSPDTFLVGFGDSAINYRARFWIEDYQYDEAARDQVRTAIYYAFARHGIDIPWPIQVQYTKDWPEAEAATRLRERERWLASIDLFASLAPENRREIATETTSRVYGHNEAIVRQGAPGQSMFIVCSGAAAVLIEPDRREVAAIQPGGYFGEMSLLTGEPRTATVVARGDTVVMEIDVAQFRRLAETDPQAVEQIGVAAMTRRIELDAARQTTTGATAAEAPATFLTRMRKFLRVKRS